MSVELTEEMVHEEAEYFLLTAARNGSRSLHLPREGTTPLCNIEGIAVNITRKETEVIPVGYHPVCKTCKREFQTEL